MVKHQIEQRTHFVYFSLILFTFFLNLSCKKIETTGRIDLKIFSTVKNPGGYPCEVLNDCRLMDLVNGGGTSSLLQCQSFPPAQVFNGMISFNSRNAMRAYLVALDSLVVKWDYPYSDESYATAGNEALNAVDSFYGVSSLRRRIEQAEFLGEPLDSLAMSVIDPELETLFNDKLEVVVGDTIYKVLTPNVIGIIPNRDITALESLRARSIFSEYPGVVFYDQSQNIFYSNSSTSLLIANQVSENETSEMSTFNASGCGGPVRLSAKAELGNFWNDCRLFANLSSPVGDCGYQREYSIDWGDGVVEAFQPCQITSGSLCNSFTQACLKYHAYDPSLIPSGGSRTFTIRVQARYKETTCDPTLIGVVFQYETTYTLYAENECKKKKYERGISNPSLQFFYGGVSYRLRGKMGQNPDPFWTAFPGVYPKLWGEVIFEKLVGSSWRKTSPYFTNSLTLKGFWYSACSSPVSIGTGLGLVYSSKAKAFTKKRNISTNSGTTTLNSFQFRCDIETKHIAGTFRLDNTPLW